MRIESESGTNAAAFSPFRGEMSIRCRNGQDTLSKAGGQ